MKKTRFSLVVLLIAALCLGLSACNKESSGTGNNQNTEQSNPLVGKWHREYTNVYSHNTHSYRYIFENNGKGLYYVTMVETGTGVGSEETSKEFKYEVATNGDYMVVTIDYYTIGETDVFDDVYIVGDVLHMGGNVYERM